MSSLAKGLVGDISLIPRLWPAPKYPSEVVEDIVLVRLGVSGFDVEEYAKDFAEAVEALDAV